MLELLVFILLIILYCIKDRTWFYLTILIVVAMGMFVCLKLGSNTAPLLYHIVPLSCVLSIIPFYKKYFVFLVGSLGVLIVYLAFKAALWDFSFFSNFAVLKNAVFCVCIGLSMWENNRIGRVKLHRVINGVYLLLLFEITVSWLQFFFPFILDFCTIEECSWRGETMILATSRTLLSAEGRIMIGTLLGASSFSLFLVICVFTLILQELLHPSKSKVKLVILVLGYITSFFTGIRTPFFMETFFILISFFYFKKSWFWLAFVAGVVLIPTLSIASLASGDSTAARMFLGIQLILSGNAGMLDSTLMYTIFLVPYFIQNPLFGVTLFNKTGYYMLSGHYLADMSTSDAYLMYLLCEIGLIGVSLFLYPIFKLRKKASVAINKKAFILLIAFGLSLGIVDQGIFSYSCLVQILIGIIICSEKEPAKYDLSKQK